MRWGKQVKFLEEVEQQLGEEPEALRERIKPYDHNVDTIMAFNILSRSRVSGQAIQVSEIIAYGQAMHVIDIESFVIIVQAADGAYISNGRNSKLCN